MRSGGADGATGLREIAKPAAMSRVSPSGSDTSMLADAP